MTNNSITYTFKQFSYQFFTSENKSTVHIWLTDAMFSTVQIGRFDPYAFKFKFLTWRDIPKDLLKVIDAKFKNIYQPTKLDFRNAK